MEWRFSKVAVSSNAARVTMKTLFVKKAIGNHLMKATSLENTQNPAVSGFCYARNRVRDAHNFMPPLSVICAEITVK